MLNLTTCRVFEKLKRLALAGDMDAIRELLNRTLGKVRHLESSLAGIRLPDITNPRDVTRAANAIFHGLTEGTLSLHASGGGFVVDSRPLHRAAFAATLAAP